MTDSAPDLDILADAVLAAYALPIRPVISYIRAGQGQSQIYRVEAGFQTTILRLYGPQPDNSSAWIESEAAWLCFLQHCGCHVAAPLARSDGMFVAPLPGMDVSQYACLFTFAEGTPQWPPTPAQSEQLGAALARLHQVSDTYTPTSSVRCYDLDTLIERPLASMLPFVTAPEDRIYLRQLGDQIATALSAIPNTAPFYGMIHGDVHQGNAHFTSSGDLMLFDFTLCGLSWRIYDFTGFLWPLRDESINDLEIRTACDHFVAGYQTIRPLSAAEQAAIPACVKARDFWEMSDWIATDSETKPAVFADWMQSLLARFRATPLNISG